MGQIFNSYIFQLLLRILLVFISTTGGLIAIFSNIFSTDFYFILALLISFPVIFIFSMTLYFQTNHKRTVKCLEEIHEFCHLLRDEFSALEEANEEKALTNEELVMNLKETSQKSVDILSKLLSNYTGEKICVHIKHFPERRRVKIVSKEDSLQTLCMSGNTDKSRLTVRKHKIKDNTYFSNIFIHDQPHFAASNLKKKCAHYKQENQDEFKISSNNFEKWYKSVIIVPIRLRIEEKKENEENKIQYTYLGVVFCDSAKEKAFRNYQMDILLHITKVFSDSLYTYFYRVIQLQTNLTEKN